jgi:two-component system response regulator YesN
VNAFLRLKGLNDAERYEYFREISMAHYEQDYKEVMRQILEKITAQIGVTQKTVDDRIPRMLAFIEKNYEQDLRLEDMAEEFNFNYHYLSAYFHQNMKEGFSDYLNEIRTAKACELLENTDLSIAQISEKVGYSEHSYFCRVFKKVTGKTPSVYRRKNHG